MTSHTEPAEHLQEGLAARAEALESLLIEKGLVTGETLDAIVTEFEERIGPMNGAKAVAKAWTDPAYKSRLLENGRSAIEELGFGGPQTEELVVVENSDDLHNVVVCTLCSCYPWAVLGLPPAWYKEPSYRSRIVREPRKVLSEFGLNLPDTVEIRVWDSSAEVRYLILPQRPAGTENMGEEELAELVTRDAMIGVAKVATPT